MDALENHELLVGASFEGVTYERRPAKAADGSPIEGLFQAWITLDRPAALNAYTTDMVRGLIVSFQRANAERDVVAIVLTGSGSRSFCTGGDAKHYAEAYAGRPDEFRQYLRLFSDAITQILLTDKPVINRVNGMRLAGGNELGLACDITIASDLAVFGQAGPKHGSAPIMGSTDLLPLFVGIERALVSCTLCEPWTAYEAVQYGLATRAVPVLQVDGAVIPNPMVTTETWLRDGQVVYGQKKSGDALATGKATFKSGTIDLAPLDAAVDELLAGFVMTMPGCLTKTLESVRSHKFERWSRNKEGARNWLAMNMATEAKAGFRAFSEGPKDKRHVDYVKLRRRLAEGAAWGDDLIDSVMP